MGPMSVEDTMIRIKDLVNKAKRRMDADAVEKLAEQLSEYADSLEVLASAMRDEAKNGGSQT